MRQRIPGNLPARGGIHHRGAEVAIEANPERIRAYGTYLGAEAAYNLPVIEKHAVDFGLKTDNVGGAAGVLLKPFGDAINEVARPAVEGVFHAFGWAMAELGDAFIDVADDIAGREEDNTHLFYRSSSATKSLVTAKGPTITALTVDQHFRSLRSASSLRRQTKAATETSLNIFEDRLRPPSPSPTGSWNRGPNLPASSDFPSLAKATRRPSSRW